MKKQNTLKYKTRDELLHLWANGKIYNSRVVGNYKIIDGELYIKNKQITTTIDNIKYICKFDNYGRFGTGIHYVNLLGYFPNIDNIYVCNIVPKVITPTWFLDEYLEDRKNAFNRLSFYKEVLKNKKLKVYNSVKANIFYVNFPKKLQNTKEYKEFLELKIVKSVQHLHYISYGKYRFFDEFEINHTVKDILNKQLYAFFSKEEMDYLDYRFWINKYKTSGSCDSLLPLYKDCKLRKEHEDKINAQIELKKIKAREEAKKEDLINLKKALNSITNFREDKINNIFGIPFVIFKLKKDTNSIRSSLGVNISIEDAKKALNLFRIKFKQREIVSGYKYEGIIEMDIPYIENDEVKYQKETCMKIGCHIIPESEINNFIAYYKLDW